MMPKAQAVKRNTDITYQVHAENSADKAEDESEEEDNMAETEDLTEGAEGETVQSQAQELEIEGESAQDLEPEPPQCSSQQAQASAAGAALRGIPHISRLDQAWAEVRASAIQA
jgi:hypothetical protein